MVFSYGHMMLPGLGSPGGCVHDAPGLTGSGLENTGSVKYNRGVELDWRTMSLRSSSVDSFPEKQSNVYHFSEASEEVCRRVGGDAPF